jgi:hypothetical protein
VADVVLTGVAERTMADVIVKISIDEGISIDEVISNDGGLMESRAAAEDRITVQRATAAVAVIRISSSTRPGTAVELATTGRLEEEGDTEAEVTAAAPTRSTAARVTAEVQPLTATTGTADGFLCYVYFR